MLPHDELPPEDQDWHRFRQLSQLSNHWERRDWTDRRQSYHWFLTFERVSGLQALAAQCQDSFRYLPQFDIVPLEALHLTVERLAFTDEIAVVSLEAAVASVRQGCRDLTPFWLRIGWLAGSKSAIRFTALPVEPVVKVRDTVLAQAALINVHKNESAGSADRFWPHVSIAYSNAAQPVAPIAAKIDSLRSLPSIEVLITCLALVELRREKRAYRWEVLERVELGG